MADTQLSQDTNDLDIEEPLREATRLSKCLEYAIEGLKLVRRYHMLGDKDYNAILNLATLAADKAEEALNTFDAWAEGRPRVAGAKISE